MDNNLPTYLHDHLAGAKFAVSLLADLGSQEVLPKVATLANTLLTEIEADRDVLEQITQKVASGPSTVKELAAWIAQRTGRMKISVGDEIGIFEGVELLSLGVMGKRALWKVLQSLSPNATGLDRHEFERLIERAESQYATLEALRLDLAARVFRTT